MKIRLASDLQSDSIVDGEGIRTVIWTQGCAHHCLGCHNQPTWDFEGGVLVDVEEVKEVIDELVGQDGITFSGGDPMYQVESCLEIAKYCKSKGYNIWCYTGFTYEQLIKRNDLKTLEFLSLIDVLVDGRFILKERSLNLHFKGSRNQRIIDMPKTLKENKIVLIKKYEEKEEKTPRFSGVYI